MNHCLATKHLSYSINQKDLLQNIGIEFQQGFLHGILGPNGSGKSTLLKNLAGIWKPTLGDVLWNGASLLNQDRLKISQTVSLVSHQPPMTFDFLVQDIVAMGRYCHHTKYWEASQGKAIERALQMVNASHLRTSSILQLSQGQRQLVYIARALATESYVLLLDEPTANLDLHHQLMIWKLLKNLVESGKLVIITTHDLSTASQYCDRVAVLNRGKCLAYGTFDEQLSPECLQDVFGVIEAPDGNSRKYSLI